MKIEIEKADGGYILTKTVDFELREKTVVDAFYKLYDILETFFEEKPAAPAATTDDEIPF